MYNNIDEDLNETGIKQAEELRILKLLFNNTIWNKNMNYNL